MERAAQLETQNASSLRAVYNGQRVPSSLALNFPSSGSEALSQRANNCQVGSSRKHLKQRITFFPCPINCKREQNECEHKIWPGVEGPLFFPNQLPSI